MPKAENSDPARVYALSLKQPWAALLVAGRKTIEVRNWPTVRRGRILIHAARVSDDRPEAWAQVPADIRLLAERIGGIVGAAELVDYVTYRSREAFAGDQTKHLNHPEWFNGRTMYGFTFANATVLPFRAYAGWMRFFPVDSEG
jgi:hypothetical protein